MFWHFLFCSLYSTVHAVISAVYSTDTFWIYLIYYSILFPLCKSHFFKLVSYGIAQCSCSGSEFSARAPCDLGYTCNWGRTQDHFHGLGVQESYFFRRYNMHSTKILYSISDFQPVGYFWKIQDHWFVPSEEIVLSVSVSHRRWIKTEEKAKVVGAAGEEEFIQFLAALAVLPWTIWFKGWIAPGWFERKGWFHPILQNRPRQNS